MNLHIQDCLLNSKNDKNNANIKDSAMWAEPQLQATVLHTEIQRIDLPGLTWVENGLELKRTAPEQLVGLLRIFA